MQRVQEQWKTGGKLVDKVLATKGAFQHPKLLASHEEHDADLYEMPQAQTEYT